MEQLIVFLATILFLVFMVVYLAYLNQIKDRNDAKQSILLNRVENLPDEFLKDPYEILFGYKENREKRIEKSGGIKKLISQVKKEHIHSDDFGDLFRVFYKRGNRYYYFVKVINGTPEPDGSYTEYFLEVPPDMETAKEAVAWTYGIHPDDYNLIIRT